MKSTEPPHGYSANCMRKQNLAQCDCGLMHEEDCRRMCATGCHPSRHLRCWCGDHPCDLCSAGEETPGELAGEGRGEPFYTFAITFTKPGQCAARILLQTLKYFCSADAINNSEHAAEAVFYLVCLSLTGGPLRAGSFRPCRPDH